MGRYTYDGEIHLPWGDTPTMGRYHGRYTYHGDTPTMGRYTYHGEIHIP